VAGSWLVRSRLHPQFRIIAWTGLPPMHDLVRAEILSEFEKHNLVLTEPFRVYKVRNWAVKSNSMESLLPSDSGTVRDTVPQQK